MITESIEEDVLQSDHIIDLNYFFIQPSAHGSAILETVLVLRNPFEVDSTNYYVHLRDRFHTFFMLNKAALTRPGSSFKVFGKFQETEEGFKIVIDSMQNFILFCSCQSIAVSELIKSNNQGSKKRLVSTRGNRPKITNKSKFGNTIHRIFAQIFLAEAKDLIVLNNLIEEDLVVNSGDIQPDMSRADFKSHLMEIGGKIQRFYLEYFVKQRPIIGEMGEKIILKNAITSECTFDSDRYRVNGRIDLIAECDYWPQKNSRLNFSRQIIIELKTGHLEYAKYEEQVILYSMSALDKTRRSPVSLLVYTHGDCLDIKPVYNNLGRFREIIWRRNEMAVEQFMTMLYLKNVVEDVPRRNDRTSMTNPTPIQTPKKSYCPIMTASNHQQTNDKENQYNRSLVKDKKAERIRILDVDPLRQSPMLIKLFKGSVFCDLHTMFSTNMLSIGDPDGNFIKSRIIFTTHIDDLESPRAMRTLIIDQNFFYLINTRVPDKKIKCYIQQTEIGSHEQKLFFTVNFLAQITSVLSFFEDQKTLNDGRLGKNWMIYFKFLGTKKHQQALSYVYLAPESLTSEIVLYFLKKKLQYVSKLATLICPSVVLNLSRRLIRVNPSLQPLEFELLQRLFTNRSAMLATYTNKHSMESCLKALLIFLYISAKRLNCKQLIVFKNMACLKSMLELGESSLGKIKYLRLLSYLYSSAEARCMLEGIITEITYKPKLFYCTTDDLANVPNEDLNAVDSILLLDCEVNSLDFFKRISLHQNKLIFINHIDTLQKATASNFQSENSFFKEIFREVILKGSNWVHL